MSNSPRFLSTREVASCIGIHVRAVSHLVAAGELSPAFVAPGGPHGTYMFDPADIEAFKRSGEADKRTGTKQ